MTDLADNPKKSGWKVAVAGYTWCLPGSYLSPMSCLSTKRVFRGASRHQGGFSVIEVLLVVMIILIIAGISVPTFLHARMRANEAAAMASVRAINTAEAMYAITYPAVGYSNSLANLGSHGSNCETPSSTNACLLDDSVASGMKSGYTFDLTGDGNTPSTNYTLKATPESTITAGHCSFVSDHSGSITPINATATVQGSKSSSVTSAGCDL